MDSASRFDPDCRRCARLADFLDRSRETYPDYFCAPVPAFGVADPRVLVVGLAPGLHGANASGRPFTGDYAGILLYQTLHSFGFATAPQSLSVSDGLQLVDCRITNAVKCVPPQNKPSTGEINNCRAYLSLEIADLKPGALIVALGTIAHRSVVAAARGVQSEYPFAHAAEHSLPGGRILIDSYHCSRYNTQTRRLTQAMFEEIFVRVRALLQ